MKFKGLLGVVAFFAAVLFAYGPANGQIPEKVKDAAGKVKDVTVEAADKTKDATVKAADKTKDVTVGAAKKTKVVVTDGLEKAADKTGDAAAATGKAVKSTSKTIGHHTVNVTEDVAGDAYEGGKYYMVTTWDGTKWVSKRTRFETKKAASATKDAVQ
jgi:hypothetical protein